MFQFFDSLNRFHDGWLVALAVCVSVFCASSTVLVGRRALRKQGAHRYLWVSGAALVSGMGSWGTHFILMTAHQAYTFVELNPLSSLVAAGLAIGFSWLGWAAVTRRSSRMASSAGGAILGLAIVSVHLISVMGAKSAGLLAWSSISTFGLLSLGLLGGAVGPWVFPKVRGRGVPVWPTLFATVVVLGFYYTLISGLQPVNDWPLLSSDASNSARILAVAIAFGVLPMTGLGLLISVFDVRLRDRKRAEARRIKVLANATFEGLIVVQKGVIRDMNQRICRMLDLYRSDLINMPVSKVVRDQAALEALESADEAKVVECQLRRRNGATLSVRIQAKDYDLGAGPARVYAIRDVSEEKRAHAKIMHMAHHDPLTGLPNRLHFRESLEAELKKAWEEDAEVAVMCFNLDRFKEVNDVHGHAAGDQLLKAVAGRIQDALPSDAITARLSGDEFAVVLPDVKSRLEALMCAQRVVNNVGSPITFGTVNLNVSASGGLTMFPLDGEAPDRLLNQADLALYRAKGQGRNCVCEFDPELGRLTQERRLLAAALTLALEDELFELHYQPQLLVGQGEIIGYEALVRWNDEKRGYVTPSVFVQLAEETGHILKLGQWVLEQACREAVCWPNECKISVNVSPAQFKQGNIVYAVEKALKLSGLDPQRLDIEITEGVLIDDEDRALEILQRLKQIGVSLSIDDFGTGYASLSYLRAFPFDTVKIDRRFISGIQDDAEAQIIVQSTIGLARQLRRGVVVEGVETFEELAALGAQPDIRLQGYLLSPPMTRGKMPGFDNESAAVRQDIQRIGSGNERDINQVVG